EARTRDPPRPSRRAARGVVPSRRGPDPRGAQAVDSRAAGIGPRRSEGGRDPEQLAVGLVGHDVERAVRSLPNVANSPAAIGEEMLLAGDAVVLERQADEATVLEAADEEAALPL